MGLKDLPCAGGEAHAKTFERLGWSRSTTRGRNPHIILTKPGCRHTLSLPNHHGKDVKRALLAGLLKLAEVSEAEYLKAFRR